LNEVLLQIVASFTCFVRIKVFYQRQFRLTKKDKRRTAHIWLLLITGRHFFKKVVGRF